MDSSVSSKDEIRFLRVCHHISNAVYTVYAYRVHILLFVFKLIMAFRPKHVAEIIVELISVVFDWIRGGSYYPQHKVGESS